ncbi:MAG: amidohydrolase [Vagococcus sp.]|jgi:amidohydrolase|nr:amidohydrolase [Vagococcus sp.]
MIEEEMLYQKMCDWRHYLHQYPELSYEEYKTSEWLQKKIREFGGFDLIKIGETSFIATIYGKKEGSKDVIAFRTDIDALPVKEETGLPYASLSDGFMHACGHDFHMSMLLGLASWLSDNQDQFSNAIKLVFQSAEEVPPGGAKEIVASGFLDDVSHIYGFHVFPGHQVGHIGIASGPITASQDIIELEIKGKGSHGATPELGVDPILVGAEIISSIHHIVSRNISAFDSAVISFGEFHAGDIFNIIPDKAVIRGNVRTTNKQVRQLIEERITQVIEGVCLANNATFKLNYTKGYGPVINDKFTTQIAYDTVKENLDEKYIFTNPQKMVSEDFSEYGKKIPSCFMILGGGLAEDGYEYMNHHPKFYLEESLMKNGVSTYINLVKKHSQL